MRFLKTLLGIYQSIIVVISIIFLFIPIFIRLSDHPGSVNWYKFIRVALLLVPAAVLCFCNAITLLFPNKILFQRWKHLGRISEVLTILWTALFIYGFFIEPYLPRPAPKVAVGQMAPDFSIKDQFGRTISLSKLRGKVVLLDFWAVSCGPCLRKLPYIQQIHDKYKDKGLIVIGIHLHSQKEKAAEFVSENNYSFSSGFDTGRIFKDYDVGPVPTYFLIDRESYLAWGPKHAPPSEEYIESLLKN